MSDVTWFIDVIPTWPGPPLVWTAPAYDTEILSLTITNNAGALMIFNLYISPPGTPDTEEGYLAVVNGNALGNSQTCLCFPRVVEAGTILTAIPALHAVGLVIAIEHRPYVPPAGVPPTVFAASVNTAGAELLVSFDKPIIGDSGFTLDATGGAVTLTPGTPGAANRRYDTSRVIAGDETLTLDYVAGDVQDYEGRPLAGFSDLVVTNNSTAGGVLLQDAFTDTNGTNLTAHAMDVGSGWTAGLGTITVSANKAFQAASATAYVADAGQADYTLSCDLTTASSGSTALGGIVRYTDASNYWIVEIDNTIPAIRLYQKTAGAYTVRASASPTISNGTTYALEVVCAGNTISATLDGGSPISYGSASQGNTSTVCGIGNTYTVNQSWDNFEVSG